MASIESQECHEQLIGSGLVRLEIRVDYDGAGQQPTTPRRTASQWLGGLNIPLIDLLCLSASLKVLVRSLKMKISCHRPAHSGARSSDEIPEGLRNLSSSLSISLSKDSRAWRTIWRSSAWMKGGRRSQYEFWWDRQNSVSTLQILYMHFILWILSSSGAYRMFLVRSVFATEFGEEQDMECQST